MWWIVIKNKCISGAFLYIGAFYQGGFFLGANSTGRLLLVWPGGGRWLDSRWYSGVTYQISGLYVNPFSHKKFLPNWKWWKKFIFHKFFIKKWWFYYLKLKNFSKFSIFLPFCMIEHDLVLILENGEKSSFFISFSSKNDNFTIWNWKFFKTFPFFNLLHDWAWFCVNSRKWWKKFFS